MPENTIDSCLDAEQSKLALTDQMIAFLDKDGDGMISKEEYGDAVLAHQERLGSPKGLVFESEGRDATDDDSSEFVNPLKSETPDA